MHPDDEPRLKARTHGFGARGGLLVGLLIGLTLGQALHWFISGPARTNRLEPGPTVPPSAEGLGIAEQKEQLTALGYASGSEKAPAASGVTRYDVGDAFDSLNLFTSGHAPAAYLMTMDGRILHQWTYPFEKLWPGVDPGQENVSYWRRAHVFESGDILAIIEPFGIFRLDKDSNLLWENRFGAHHDFYVAPNGHIFALARKKRVVQWDDGPRPVLEDWVVEIDPAGNEVRRVSVLEAMRRTPYRSLLADIPPHWDITHTNALNCIQDGVVSHIPAFVPGRFLLSLREIDTIAVLDFDTEQIVWALKGQWHRQHEPTLLDSGHILLFDNLGNDGKSKVIEIDPVSQEVVWSYGLTPDQPLYSERCGLAERLPNQNTLITEAVPGRVLEVGPDGEIVWEFINPYLSDRDEGIIATLMHFERLPATFTPRWLPGAATRPELPHEF